MMLSKEEAFLADFDEEDDDDEQELPNELSGLTEQLGDQQVLTSTVLGKNQAYREREKVHDEMDW